MITILEDKFNFHYRKWVNAKTGLIVFKRKDKVVYHKEEALSWLRLMNQLIDEYYALRYFLLDDDNEYYEASRRIIKYHRNRLGFKTLIEFYCRNYRHGVSHFERSLLNDRPLDIA